MVALGAVAWRRKSHRTMSAAVSSASDHVLGDVAEHLARRCGGRGREPPTALGSDLVARVIADQAVAAAGLGRERHGVIVVPHDSTLGREPDDEDSGVRLV